MWCTQVRGVERCGVEQCGVIWECVGGDAQALMKKPGCATTPVTSTPRRFGRRVPRRLFPLRAAPLLQSQLFGVLHRHLLHGSLVLDAVLLVPVLGVAVLLWLAYQLGVCFLAVAAAPSV